jgi:hypothetical protein
MKDINYYIDIGSLPNNETKLVLLDDCINLDEIYHIDGIMKCGNCRYPLPCIAGPKFNKYLVYVSVYRNNLRIQTFMDRTDCTATIRVATKHHI